VDHVPLSYGQLSVWRDIRDLPQTRWHEANNGIRWSLPEGGDVDPEATIRALGGVYRRHPALRTRYSWKDKLAPEQYVLPPDATDGLDPKPLECAPDEAAAVLEQDLTRPFDLERESSWRTRVLTHLGRPFEVQCVKHHIAADAWGANIVETDFRAFLRGERESAAQDGPAPGPIDLARWQRSAERSTQRAATAEYWRRMLGLDATQLPGAADSVATEEILHYSIRSERALRHAQALADRLGVLTSSVVLAAYLRCVADVVQEARIVAQLMSANRHLRRLRDVVTSTNQWVVLAAQLGPSTPSAGPGAAGVDFADQVTAVHEAALRAYRHGMYDVDEIDRLSREVRGETGDTFATCAFNYVRQEGISALMPQDPESLDEPVWSRPLHGIGHPCYLRAFDEGGRALALGLRTKGVPRDIARKILEGTHALLLSADANR
jgi:condensation domain-containing protein